MPDALQRDRRCRTRPGRGCGARQAPGPGPARAREPGCRPRSRSGPRSSRAGRPSTPSSPRASKSAWTSTSRLSIGTPRRADQVAISIARQLASAARPSTPGLGARLVAAGLGRACRPPAAMGRPRSRSAGRGRGGPWSCRLSVRGTASRASSLMLRSMISRMVPGSAISPSTMVGPSGAAPWREPGPAAARIVAHRSAPGGIS